MQEPTLPLSLKQNIFSFLSTMEEIQTRLLGQGDNATNLHHPARTCFMLSHLSKTLLNKLDSSVKWDDCAAGTLQPSQEFGPLQLTQQSITDGDGSFSSQQLSQGSIFGTAFSQESRVGNPLQLGFSQE